ncbi:hypothetical protein DH2020_046470 [Rehmannia glutinosa]|uniref:Terpene synthase metal-binding domain-containing protein n=1 Tax=Rehmannia glutinosa TaxID=99300 RepID=A0ABR0UBU2_REHGL
MPYPPLIPPDDFIPPLSIIPPTGAKRTNADRGGFVHETARGSMQETADKFIELAEEAWKDLNTEWILAKNAVPKDMVELVLGYARSSEIFYRSCEDGFSKPDVMAHHIAALFVDPIII